jgi:tRNA pseudouridine38-40 synthase
MMHEGQKRFKLIVEYDGSDFVGWQLQPNGRSVQGALETALRALFSIDVRVHGAGRTDAGVHATGQVAHFDLVTQLDANTMMRALNAELPADVTVHAAEISAPDFHSRFSASSRSYVYTIAHDRLSLARRTQWILYAALDHEAIEAAVACLRGTHDFTAFSKYVPGLSHHYCHVFRAEWQSGEATTHFHIRANRFLD